VCDIESFKFYDVYDSSTLLFISSIAWNILDGKQKKKLWTKPNDFDCEMAI